MKYEDFISIKLPKANHYWIGFSGGCDSLALLLRVSEFVSKDKFTAVHFNHGLRENLADDDAKWCEEFCKNYNFNFININLNVNENMAAGESMEEAARRLRMEQWQSLAKLDDVVLLAHHQDDVLEELFLRLARGSNSTGLTSLRATRTLFGVNYCRPLLSIRKEHLKKYLANKQINNWREDHTNKENIARRNSVRNLLLPLFNEIFENDIGLVDSCNNLLQEAEYLEECARKEAQNIKDVQGLRNLPKALLPRVMRCWIKNQTNIDCLLNKNDIKRLHLILESENEEPVKLILANNSVVIRFQLNNFRIINDKIKLQTREWNWEENPELHLPEIATKFSAVRIENNGEINFAEKGVAFFAAENFPKTLTIRSRKKGDTINALGRTSPSKVKKLLIEKGIPQEEREATPIICCEDEILWIPQVRRSNLYLADKQNILIKITFFKD